jgi:archaellum component FlaC
MSNKRKKSPVRGSKDLPATASKQGNRQVLADEKKPVEGEAAVSEHKIETDTIKQDEEISTCFEAAKQKIRRLLTSKKQVIKDLACELERLGRPVDHIAAEIVHELRDCEELSEPNLQLP